MRSILIGVDGGGTKTNLIALNAATGETLATASTGSIHALSFGIDTALENLKAGIAALALPSADSIVGLALGDPSIDDSDCDSCEKEYFLNKAQALLPETKCFSKSDVFMALYAFSGGEPAALLIAGTGSMGIALTEPYCHEKGNAVVTVGGWGDPTFDPGSGYHIAAEGIRAAINTFDGIAPGTALCDVILPFFGASVPRKLIDLFNSNTLSRSDIAAFARQVDACAKNGDITATEILIREGQVLGQYACSLLRHTNQKSPKIGIYGSVLLNNEIVRKHFEITVQASFASAEICIPTRPPEYGAALFAADALNIDRSTWL